MRPTSSHPSPQVFGPGPFVEVVEVMLEGPGVQVLGVLSRHGMPGHLNTPSLPHSTIHVAEHFLSWQGFEQWSLANRQQKLLFAATSCGIVTVKSSPVLLSAVTW